jgi:hypothetical protein
MFDVVDALFELPEDEQGATGFLGRRHRLAFQVWQGASFSAIRLPSCARDTGRRGPRSFGR